MCMKQLFHKRSSLNFIEIIVFILVGHRVPKLKRTHREIMEESSATYLLQVKVYVSNIGSVGSITSTFIYRPI